MFIGTERITQEWVKKFESRVYSLIEASCKFYNSIIEENYSKEANERKNLLKKKVRKIASNTVINWIYNANIKGILNKNLSFSVHQIINEEDLSHNIEKFFGISQSSVKSDKFYTDKLLRFYNYISKPGNPNKPPHERIYEALLIKESNLHLSLPPNLIKKYFNLELFGTENNTVVDFLAPFEIVSKGNVNKYGGKCLGSFHTWNPPENPDSEKEEFCFSPQSLMSLSSSEECEMEEPYFDKNSLNEYQEAFCRENSFEFIRDILSLPETYVSVSREDSTRNVLPLHENKREGNKMTLSPPLSPKTGVLSKRSNSEESFFGNSERISSRKLFSDLDPILFGEELNRHETEKKIYLANPPFDPEMIIFLAERINYIMDNNTTIIVTIPIWDNETKAGLNAKTNQSDFIGYKLLKESPWFYDEKLSNAFIHRFYSYSFNKYISASSCHVMLFRSGNGCVTLEKFLKDWEKEGPERNYININYNGASHSFEYQDDDFRNGIIFGIKILEDGGHFITGNNLYYTSNKSRITTRTSLGDIWFTSKNMFFRGAAIVMKKILDKPGKDVYEIIQHYYPEC